MEEKESTVSGSPGNSETESTPVSGGQQVMNMMQSMEKSSLDLDVVGGGGGGSNGSTVVDLLGKKKKRGRPRKYDSDGNLTLSYIKSSQSVVLSPPPGFSMSPPPPPSSDNYSSSSSKRGRGRPPGSGNWQLLASLGELTQFPLGDMFANTAGGDFIPHVVTVSTGEDVASKILSFSQKGPRGICVLSANGAVSNVTIRQPGSSGGILTYEGRFELVSLTGSFTITDNGGVKSRTGGLSVSLAGPDGRVIGGGIAGLLTASSPIQIVVGSFTPNGYKVHKRKHHRDSPTASIIPSVSDTVTTTRPTSQAIPVGETCQTPTYPLQGQSCEETQNGNKEILNVTSSHSFAWNGLSVTPDHRPSPDINMSAPGE